ncbi:MAG: hypothetical protein COB10_00030 [Planctomycetota bacterium]|nr:MAG: hypothetical protein COB10_00030 [Planctomycetota bacterium]HIC22338.1 hypothetical protein [Planctomycetota bacterium]
MAMYQQLLDVNSSVIRCTYRVDHCMVFDFGLSYPRLLQMKFSNTAVQLREFYIHLRFPEAKQCIEAGSGF